MHNCSFVSNCELSLYVCGLDPLCRGCFMTRPPAARCAAALGNVQDSCGAGTAGAANDHYVVDCQEAVAIGDRVVWATVFFGWVSIFAVLAVLLVIYGYNKDRRSHRDRILVGMFVGNLLFSIANAMPYQVFGSADNASCDDPTYGIGYLCAGTLLWLGGKYVMVSYEIFIVAASIVSLKTGSITMPWRHELPAHVACAAVGAIVLVYFDAECVPLMDALDTDQAGGRAATNAATASADAAAKSKAGLALNVIEARLLQVWLGFLGVVLAAWGVQRLYLHRLIVGWNTRMLEVVESVEYELWTRGSKEVEEQRARHRILLAQQKQSYLEIARPLEPFIAVFVAFSIPAIVMATDVCARRSSSQAYVECDILCQFVLSFRALATSGVYFSDAQCRAQLRAPGTLLCKVGRRLAGFGGWCCGKLAGDDDAAGYRIHFATELEDVRGEPGVDGDTGAGVPYALMEPEA